MQNKNIIYVVGILVIILIGFSVFGKSNTAVEQTTDNVDVTTDVNASGGIELAKEYTLVEIASHNTREDCWATINGGVYDLTDWVPQHPGGEEAIMSLCGTDGSQAFTTQHGGQERPEFTLTNFQIGVLKN